MSYNSSDNIQSLNKEQDSLLKEDTGWQRHSPCWLLYWVFIISETMGIKAGQYVF